MKTDIKKLPIPLPKGMIAKDLEYPKYDSRDQLAHDVRHNRFEMYAVSFRNGSTEWVIATLQISNGSRRNPAASSARTYAVRVSNGALCRVGKGPHVKATIAVYVRKSRVAALASLLKLLDKGEEEAHQVRDRISSRRAQGQVMRAEGRRSWRWDT